MQQDTAVSAIAHTIELSIAPVFLISGIAALLAVLTSRLSRIVDRSRALEAVLPPDMSQAATIGAEMKVLFRRAKLINEAITLCTMTALLIAAVIAILFLSAFLQFDMAVPVALLFIAGMGALLLGLVSFLREIFLATASLRIGPHQFPRLSPTPVPEMRKDQPPR
ncbi:MAG: DUF2721 domain-containing protein [Gemmatimonadetes bacterium]|nr:DUF2721 domain-containing protein [Gemmatimonadota bacterium]